MISVTVCTYNRLEYLKAALDSVYGQSLQDFEVVLVDDGSTDGTSAWIEDRRFPRLRFFKHERNLGPVRARNKALSEACGDLVAFLDSDDLFYPTYLERMAAEFDDARVMVAGSYMDRMDGEGRIAPRGGATRREEKLDWFREATGLPFQLGFTMIMLRRRLLAEVGALDEGFLGLCEDTDLLYRVGLRFGREVFRFIDEPLVAYRKHGRLQLTDPLRRHRTDGPGIFRPGEPPAELSLQEKQAAVDLAYFCFKHRETLKP